MCRVDVTLTLNNHLTYTEPKICHFKSQAPAVWPGLLEGCWRVSVCFLGGTRRERTVISTWNASDQWITVGL